MTADRLTLHQLSETGARYLDGRDQFWPAVINIDELRYPTNDVLSQLYGSHPDALNELGLHAGEARSYGLMLPVIRDRAIRVATGRLFMDAWARQIKLRLAGDALVS